MSSLLKAVGEPCNCDEAYSIERHGDAYALYKGRCPHRHGLNLCRISEVAFNCDLKELERALNATTYTK